MAKLEDRLRSLEDRKRQRTTEDLQDDNYYERQANESPTNQLSVSGRRSTICPSVELDSDSDSPDAFTPRHCRRQRYSKGIKVVPTYTLKTSSSLREWGDWKRDIERVFEGDPYTYRTGAQKILKALDYLDSGLKSLWYTHSEQEGGIQKWSKFLYWTRTNVQHGQNATATLYDQLNEAQQLPGKSPIQFNAYLAAIEQDLPQQPETVSAMTFHSKLTEELKKQFRASNISIPETRAECVAVAQRVWEGLYKSGRKRRFMDTDKPDTPPKYPRIGSERDRKDRYHQEHCSRDDRNKDLPRNRPSTGQPEKELVCYQCNKPGHYATSCPDRKEPKKAKIQSTQQDYNQSPDASTQPSRSGSETPKTLDKPTDSDDSLN